MWELKKICVFETKLNKAFNIISRLPCDDDPSIIYLPHHQIGHGSGSICVISTTSPAIVLLLLAHCPLQLHYIVGVASTLSPYP